MIGIIHYQMGNVTSVRNAFEFLGVPVKIVETPDTLAEVTHIVLPGVGAFYEGMKSLRKLGFADALVAAAVKEQKPLLGLCLGMQLLVSSGDEGGEAEGLGLIPGRVKRLPEEGIRVPHVGWNTANVVRANALMKNDADFYFVHSYYVAPEDSASVIATTEYGITFPSAIARGKIFGMQFHPEKSDKAGLEILKNFSYL